MISDSEEDSEHNETQGGHSHDSSVGDSSQTQEEVGFEDTQDSQRSQRSEYRAQKSRDAYETLKQTQENIKKINKRKQEGNCPSPPPRIKENKSWIWEFYKKK